MEKIPQQRAHARRLSPPPPRSLLMRQRLTKTIIGSSSSTIKALMTTTGTGSVCARACVLVLFLFEIIQSNRYCFGFVDSQRVLLSWTCRNSKLIQTPSILYRFSSSSSSSSSLSTLPTYPKEQSVEKDDTAEEKDHSASSSIASKTYMPWNDRVRQLQEYYDQHGTTLISSSSTASLDPSLAPWLNLYRSQYRKYLSNEKSILNEQKVADLNRVDINWWKSRRQRNWEVSQTINCNSSHGWKQERGEKQPTAKSQTLPSLFPKINKLDFDDHIQELKAFKDKHGHTIVRLEHGKLYNWLSQQRAAYKAYIATNATNADNESTVSSSTPSSVLSPPSVMTAEKINALNEIDPEWYKGKYERIWDEEEFSQKQQFYSLTWDEKINELRKFQRQHGHVMVPKIHPQNRPFGTWMHYQRLRYRKFLEHSTPSSSSSSSSNYDNEDGEAKNVQQQEQQRRQTQKSISTMTEQEIQSLHDIDPNWYKLKSDINWESKYNDLVQFQKEYGHCCVPTNYAKNRRLSHFVRNTRQLYKARRGGKLEQQPNDADDDDDDSVVKNSLTDERIKLLDNLGFVWNGSDCKKISSQINR